MLNKWRLSNKCPVIIRYAVVCGIEEASVTDRTLDPGDAFEENH